jgi:hypothetical protein
VSFVIIALLSGYISFLLVSYVIYAFVYSRITGLRRADFVVVLGAGLNEATGSRRCWRAGWNGPGGCTRRWPGAARPAPC